MQAFNHDFILGMMDKRFGVLWRPMEYHVSKVPTISRVTWKFHNMCMDWWMINNPVGACLGKFPDSIPFSDDSNLWDVFDIWVGLDDVFELPEDEAVVEWLQNQYGRLGDRHGVYAARNIPL